MGGQKVRFLPGNNAQLMPFFLVEISQVFGGLPDRYADIGQWLYLFKNLIDP